MKKVFKLIDLDCANCAAKMENAIKDLPEVEDAVVSFMTQKMTIKASDGTDFDALMDKVYTPSRRSHLHGLSEPPYRTLRATFTE